MTSYRDALVKLASLSYYLVGLVGATLSWPWLKAPGSAIQNQIGRGPGIFSPSKPGKLYPNKTVLES